MSYKVNGKNLAVGRLMPRGKTAEARLKYLHVDSKGMSAVSSSIIARVSLPEGDNSTPLPPLVFPQAVIDDIPRLTPESLEIIQLPAGEPAASGARFLVPNIEKLFPTPQEQTSEFTVNGDLLRRLLTVACEVTNDADKTMRLRFCAASNSLRVDTYRQPGEQEFVGVIKGLKYSGQYIPGGVTEDTPTYEAKPVQGNVTLKAMTGRRFRGENE